ncbi:MAG: threonine--tRNA ligase [Elusimicrobia bacterium RIFOXYA2_FULL_50_26]|nr:MAG: threonine--tRNA ligase [Elusimicrobia bacterium RIFOXYA2_FULL_50_26]
MPPFDIQTLRHSAAHIMAAAVVDLFPETKIAIGPATDEGFYYDFDRPAPFTPEDLEKIEQRMREIVKENAAFTRIPKSREDALAFFTSKQEKYKVELINALPAGEEITLYESGKFVDLCRGPHAASTGQVQHFKLLSIAGAYWRGDSEREQLQRIYGTAFFTQQELDDHLKKIEEAKKRDHRRLGKDLKLFSIHESVGGGLVHWHPKGTIIKNIVENYWRDLHAARGYQLVSTPHIASEEIYRVSGHLQNYADMMYAPMEIEGRPYRVKPMNCPGHIMIYQTELHSYRELPIRIAELGTVYRFEKSGVLHGLLRVRGFSIDDAHIIVMPEQIEEEILSVFNMALEFLRTFGFNEFEIYLATRPHDKYAGNIEDWQKAEDSLKAALSKTGLPFKVDEGGGAFYGPKIDVKVKDCLGRPWQCSTIQFDFNLPERFDITYVDNEGKRARPYMVHRALMGSMERFMGVLIEHYGGAFPLWLAPVQATVLNITDKQAEYCAEVTLKLKNAGIRTECDGRNEKINLKIREATLQKIPYMAVIGEREKQAGTVAVRSRHGKDMGAIKVEDFIELLKTEAAGRI